MAKSNVTSAAWAALEQQDKSAFCEYTGRDTQVFIGPCPLTRAQACNPASYSVCALSLTTDFDSTVTERISNCYKYDVITDLSATGQIEIPCPPCLDDGTGVPNIQAQMLAAARRKGIPEFFSFMVVQGDGVVQVGTFTVTGVTPNNTFTTDNNAPPISYTFDISFGDRLIIYPKDAQFPEAHLFVPTATVGNIATDTPFIVEFDLLNANGVSIIAGNETEVTTGDDIARPLLVDGSNVAGNAITTGVKFGQLGCPVEASCQVCLTRSPSTNTTILDRWPTEADWFEIIDGVQYPAGTVSVPDVAAGETAYATITYDAALIAAMPSTVQHYFEDLL